MARRIQVTIVGDADKLDRSFKQASRSAGHFGRTVGISLGSLAKIGAAVALLEKLRQTVHLGVEEFADHAKVTAQTRAALQSTGNIAGVSAKEIDELGLSLSNLSGIDDEVVQAGENVLLSFTKIRNQAGKGNDIFKQAAKASVDWAARTGKSVVITAQLLGRALEDPARKATSLSRAGVVFSTAQLKQIKAWEAGGNVLKAQQFILAGIEKRFGGAAKAAGQTLPGELNVLRDRFKDLAGAAVGLAAPAVEKVAVSLTGLVRRISAAKGLRAKLAIVWEGVQAAAAGAWHLLERAIRGLTANLRAKLDVVWTGIEQAGGKAQDALRQAVAAVDWSKVWANAKEISTGLQERLQAVNWGAVGKSIGSGIAKAVKLGVEGVKGIAGELSKIVGSVDWEQLGIKIGPGLAAAVATAFATLADPAFWARHWSLALAVAISAFPVGKLARLGERLAAPLLRLGGDLVLKIAGGIESKVPLLGRAVLSGLLKLGPLTRRALAPLAGVVQRVFAKLSEKFGKVFTFTVKVLGIQAVIEAVTGLARDVGRVFVNLAHRVERIFTEILNKIIGWVNKVSGWVNKVDVIPGVPNIPQIGKLGGKQAPAAGAPAGPRGPIAAPGRAPSQQLQPVPVSDAEIKRLERARAAAERKAGVIRGKNNLDRSLGLADTTTTAKTFALPFRLQLEEAKATASRSQAALVRAAKDARAFLLKAIPKLHGQRLLTAYGLLASANDTIASAVKAAADKAKAAADNLRQKIAALKDKFAQAVDGIRSQVGELFQGPVLAPTDAQKKAMLGWPSATPDVGKLTDDLKAQTHQYARFNRDLAILAKRGAPKELLKELRAKGTEALPEIEALAKASKSVLTAFFKAFGKREALVQRVARVEMKATLVTIRADRLKLAALTGRPRRMAEGGVAMRPMVAEIGEKGPEAVIPLSALRLAGAGRSSVPLSAAGAGGDRPIHVHLIQDGRETAQVVLPHIQRMARTSSPQVRGRFAAQVLGAG